MVKRGYKLQEFVAHSTNVNCLSIGKKACRLLITGGDDHKVNLWAIGKPTSLMSLCGHTSPVESVAFDSAEVLVLAGASTGVIKLWDLEEAKMVRTLTGHRSNCTAFEFHPFGEFFASGSMDANLKIWDIRKKGCIHTYKGHTRGISTIRFTPDGRWVVSGGFDDVVKVWDLTAGKLLHDFKFHEGHIRSIDFHPLEFLLATGSADRTVKFWDLETFELIGSSRPEATGVRTITFHPDGRSLFCGLDDGLKVYSWEPVVCHDAVDMGWSTLGDLCINEGKLLGCSYYRNSVGVWVADISLIEPYGAGFTVERNDCLEKQINLQGSHSLEKVESGMRSTSSLRCMSPDHETKEIKNIYIDSSGGNPAVSHGVGSLNSPKVVLPLGSEEISNVTAENRSAVIEVPAKSDGQAVNKSFRAPSRVPWDSPVGKESSNSGRESITFSRTKPGMLLKPAHIRKPSNTKYDVERLSVAVESGTLSNIKSESDSAMDPNFQTRLILEDADTKSSNEKDSDIKSVADKVEKVLSPQTSFNQVNSSEPLNYSKETNSVKFVRGVAVVSGRTRTLVEKFERRERFTGNEDKAVNLTSNQPTSMTPNQPTNMTPNQPTTNMTPNQPTSMTPNQPTSMSPNQPTGMRPNQPTGMRPNQPTGMTPNQPTGMRPNQPTSMTPNQPPSMRPNQPTSMSPNQPTSMKPNLPIGMLPNQPTGMTPNQPTSMRPNQPTSMKPNLPTSMTPNQLTSMSPNQPTSMSPNQPTSMSPNQPASMRPNQPSSMSPNQPASMRPNQPTKMTQNQPMPTMTPNQANDTTPNQATNMKRLVIPETDRTPTVLKGEPQSSGRDLTSANDVDITESLMQIHDVFLSTLRYRLTKLQVVRHFWERNDIKGAICALRKLPDHSVQADVISVLMEKMEILTLDLFACLLPVLTGLLDSKIERHANVSLEMLLKLVAVFGPVIHSTISAPRAVGVNLHAEQRLKCCNQCFIELQKTQKILPALIRRGGLLARKGHELNLVLQES